MKALVFMAAKLCLHVLVAIVLAGIVLPLFVLGVVIFVTAAIAKTHADEAERRQLAEDATRAARRRGTFDDEDAE